MDLCGMRLLGTKVCKKHDLGVHNNLFGGTMLSWIDELAVAYVNEVCFCPNMVTLKVEEVLFKSPVKENNLIKIYGEIIRIGTKSIKIAVEARKFNVYSHEESVVTTTSLVFVRIDEDGNSLPIAQHVRDKHPDKLA
jgi:acyl-CoA thioesterase YciA